MIKRSYLLFSVIAVILLLFTTYKAFRYRSILNTASADRSKLCLYRLDQFDFHYSTEADSPNIIMLGNSLIREGHWDALLNRKDVINRGIGGDKLYCICDRLQYLENTSAKICFIEGGINDLLALEKPELLFEYYKQIVLFWKGKNKIPVINLVSFIAPKASAKYESINKQIAALNSLLRTFATEQKIDIIDMNIYLSDLDKKVLKDEYTTDGVHYTASAYLIWAEKIGDILKKHKI